MNPQKSFDEIHANLTDNWYYKLMSDYLSDKPNIYDQADEELLRSSKITYLKYEIAQIIQVIIVFVFYIFNTSGNNLLSILGCILSGLLIFYSFFRIFKNFMYFKSKNHGKRIIFTLRNILVYFSVIYLLLYIADWANSCLFLKRIVLFNPAIVQCFIIFSFLTEFFYCRTLNIFDVLFIIVVIGTTTLPYILHGFGINEAVTVRIYSILINSLSIFLLRLFDERKSKRVCSERIQLIIISLCITALLAEIIFYNRLNILQVKNTKNNLLIDMDIV